MRGLFGFTCVLALGVIGAFRPAPIVVALVVPAECLNP